MIIINLLMSIGKDNYVDITGHIGGALCGLFWGMAFFPRVNHPSALKLKKVGLVLISLFFILFTTLFFTVRTPPP